MRWIEPIRLDAHVGASAAEATRMALPPQDPRLPRMPSWLFIAFTAWVAFIAYIAQIRHIWWGYAGSAATIVVALRCGNAGVHLRVSNTRQPDSRRRWVARRHRGCGQRSVTRGSRSG